MTLLDVSMIFSAILLAVTFVFLAVRPRLKARGSLLYGGLVWTFISAVIAGISNSPAVMFQFVALALIMLAMWTTFSLLSVGAAAGVATVAVYGGCFAWEEARHRQHDQWRQEFAFQSLEDRLPVAKRAGLRTELSAEQKSLLQELERKLNHHDEHYRSMALQRLHERTTHTFVNAPSFGVRRIIAPPTQKNLMIGQEIVISQPGPVGYVPGESIDVVKRSAADDALDKLHVDSQLDFLNPRGFGWVKSRAEVAGFQSHFFRAVPKSERWHVRTIDLLGLLLHKEPVVYVTANLPRMEELRKAPTRPLDDFEAASLKKLQKGESLVVDQSPMGLRMLGAIRATQQCIACHGGDEGELLGAFAYVLGPGKTSQ